MQAKPLLLVLATFLTCATRAIIARAEPSLLQALPKRAEAIIGDSARPSLPLQVRLRHYVEGIIADALPSLHPYGAIIAPPRPSLPLQDPTDSAHAIIAEGPRSSSPLLMPRQATEAIIADTTPPLRPLLRLFSRARAIIARVLPSLARQEPQESAKTSLVRKEQLLLTSLSSAAFASGLQRSFDNMVEKTATDGGRSCQLRRPQPDILSPKPSHKISKRDCKLLDAPAASSTHVNDD